MAGEEDNEAGLAEGEPGGEDQVLDNVAEIGDEDGLSDMQREQYGKGWRPREEFEGDPDEWVSAGKFKEKGEMLSEIGKLKSNQKNSDAATDKRMKNLSAFLVAQNNQLKQELESQKVQAIKQGDVKEVARLDEEISGIPKDDALEEEQETKAQKNEKIMNWKQNNAYIFDESSEKFKFADNCFKIAGAKGMNTDDSLEYVTEEVEKQYPSGNNEVNSRRNEAGLGGDAGGTGGKGRGGGGRIPKSQWTREELEIAESMEGDFSPKEIAQMVADSRKVQA